MYSLYCTKESCVYQLSNVGMSYIPLYLTRSLNSILISMPPQKQSGARYATISSVQVKRLVAVRSHGREAYSACNVQQNHRQAVIASDPPFLRPATPHSHPRHTSRQVTPYQTRTGAHPREPPVSLSARAMSMIFAPSGGASTFASCIFLSSLRGDSPLYARSKSRRELGYTRSWSRG